MLALLRRRNFHSGSEGAIERHKTVLLQARKKVALILPAVAETGHE